MAIHNLYEKEEIFESHPPKVEKGKNHFFSTLVTRFCFLFLFVADVLWLFYNAAMLLTFGFLTLLTRGKFQPKLIKIWLSFRRSVVCGLSLLIGLFSPPFGIMVACTYFLMYDKAGIDEVVPTPLKTQFKDIFQTER